MQVLEKWKQQETSLALGWWKCTQQFSEKKTPFKSFKSLIRVVFPLLFLQHKRQFAVSVSRRYFALIALSILESCMSGPLATN